MTREIDQAIKETMEFQNEIKSSQFTGITSERAVVEKTQSNRVLLTNAIARYLARLNNENVPYQVKIKKQRSPEHIKDVERFFHALVACLHLNHHDVKNLTVSELNDHIGGEFLQYLKEVKRFENRTINKYISNIRPFLKWFPKEYKMPMPDWLEGIDKLPENPKPEVISKKVYERLLERITPENGFVMEKRGKNDKRYFYTTYLKSSFKWALNTGLRREELCNLKFSDIKHVDGFSYFLVENLKVNRIQGREEETMKKYVPVPISPVLRELLDEAGYAQYKDTDRYIIAPELELNRQRIMPDTMSRGFAHFYKQVEPEGNLTFRCLRKTYITGLALYTGGNAASITQHSDNRVLERHYIDKIAMAKATQGFEPFSHENDRNEELKQMRDKSKNQDKQNNLEVEK